MTTKPVYPHPIIAREGWPFIAFFFILSLVWAFCCGWWSLPGWLLTLFSVQFFRDPARQSASDNHLDVLSPADGKIVVIEQTEDPFRQVPALKISVFMNVFNVHSNRSPLTGKIEDVRYFPGKFVNAALDKASTENERNAVLMTAVTGHKITFVQVAGLVARRILCHVKAGDELIRAERYGLIRFGSRVDVYLPPESTPRVMIGDKVSATSTVLATLPSDAATDE